jgi:hypothetical protein
LGAGSLILIPLADLLVAFLVFFWGVEVIVALCRPPPPPPPRVLDALALALDYGSLLDSPLGDRAETRITGIGMSPSTPGMGEMKLSRACIRTYKK